MDIDVYIYISVSTFIYMYTAVNGRGRAKTQNLRCEKELKSASEKFCSGAQERWCEDKKK
jgi:hypothetical protein